MDVIFYFAVSVLVATIFCWLIFLAKNAMQREEIKKELIAMQEIGTQIQKDQEKEVTTYQRKVYDFAEIFKNHKFASYAFVFMQSQTLPNVWFKQFSLNRQQAEIQLSGEAENLDALSRQVDRLEKNKYVKNLGALSSVLGEAARIQFNFSLALDPGIFNFGSEMASLTKTTTSSDEQVFMPESGNPDEAGEDYGQQFVVGANQKFITSFHLLANPEVLGTIDQENYTINVDVPYGTDLRSLAASIIVSPGATVAPAPDVTQNFSNAVLYTVTAVDGTSQIYQVRVNVLPKGGSRPAGGKSAGIVLIVIALLLISGVIGVISFFAWKNTKNKKIGGI